TDIARSISSSPLSGNNLLSPFRSPQSQYSTPPFAMSSEPEIEPTAGPSTEEPLILDLSSPFEVFEEKKFGKKKKDDLLEYTKKLYAEYQRLLALQDDDEEDAVSITPITTINTPSSSTTPLSIRDLKIPKPSSFSGTRDLTKVTNWLDEVEQY